MGAKTMKAEAETPSDLNIPDNYVQHTLQNTKPKPPITLSNLYKELNYLTCSILILNPIFGLIGASRTSLQWQTAVWAVIYYFVTGLGMFFQYAFIRLVSDMLFRHYCRVSSSLGSSLLQREQASRILARHGRRWFGSRFHQVVVSRSPCSPSLH